MKLTATNPLTSHVSLNAADSNDYRFLIFAVKAILVRAAETILAFSKVSHDCWFKCIAVSWNPGNSSSMTKFLSKCKCVEIQLDPVWWWWRGQCRSLPIRICRPDLSRNSPFEHTHGRSCATVFLNGVKRPWWWSLSLSEHRTKGVVFPKVWITRTGFKFAYIILTDSLRIVFWSLGQWQCRPNRRAAERLHFD